MYYTILEEAGVVEGIRRRLCEWLGTPWRGRDPQPCILILVRQQGGLAAWLKLRVEVAFFATPHRGSGLAFGIMSEQYWCEQGRWKLIQKCSLSHTEEAFYETAELMPGLNCRVSQLSELPRIDWSFAGCWETLLGRHCSIGSSLQHLQVSQPDKPALSDRLVRHKWDDWWLGRICKPWSEYGRLTGAEPQRSALSDKEQACPRELNSDYESHLGQVDDPIPGTCEWILAHDKWRQWDSSHNSSLLWITAQVQKGLGVAKEYLLLLQRRTRGSRQWMRHLPSFIRYIARSMSLQSSLLFSLGSSKVEKAPNLPLFPPPLEFRTQQWIQRPISLQSQTIWTISYYIVHRCCHLIHNVPELRESSASLSLE